MERVVAKSPLCGVELSESVGERILVKSLSSAVKPLLGGREVSKSVRESITVERIASNHSL